MKFAQYLNDHAVPEWKSQYLDYKQGKKKLKKISNIPFTKNFTINNNHNSPIPNNNNNNNNNNINGNNSNKNPHGHHLPINKLKHILPESSSSANKSHNVPNSEISGGATINKRSSLLSFQLPPPAMSNSPLMNSANPLDRKNWDKMMTTNQGLNQSNDRTPLLPPSSSLEHSNTHISDSTPPMKYTEVNDQDSMKFYHLVRKRSRIGSFVQSLRSQTDNETAVNNAHEMELYSEFSKNEFLSWVDEELIKVEKFYRERERHDMERFLILQNQLYQLRQQRALVKQKIRKLEHDNVETHHKLHPLDENGQEILANKLADEIDHLKVSALNSFSQINKFELPSLPSLDWLLGKEKAKEYYDKGYYTDDEEDDTVANIMEPPFSNEDLRTSEEDEENDSGNSSYHHHHEQQQNYQKNLKTNTHQDLRFNRRDYSRKEQDSQITFNVPYYIARRQIKTALFELYRSLELLKSYKILNRTAFRKMIKKFDKTTGSSIMNSYMEKIDQCYFTKSDILDELISNIEEMYAINFEKGNRKLAVAKLRSNEVFKTYYSDIFNSGLLLGLTIPLFVLALYKGLHDTITGALPEGRYLLQIWAGFLLLSLMALLFGVNCYIWTIYKVNYKFIFEFDSRTALDFRQFFMIPSLSMFMIGFFGWFSFENFWPTVFPGRYWPWFYVGFMLLILFCPFEIFHYHSRKWLLISVWRLILSGFYPVEFRDFFLGDIFCSLTYSLSNISFFFCLYGTHWRGALTGGSTICGSNSSRLMGFLATLPSIWRFMQCIRRYLDTGDWFPHLANCLKYTISTTYYALLSVYRIDRTVENRAVFIVFASINSVYSSIWDIFMDWSLMQAGSKNLFLRDTLIFKKSWFYYVAIVFDVVMRFQWIFYAFFATQIQQSAVTSFGIAFAELLRRFVWIFFRMENEHCTNVHLFRASRDTPLPYPIDKVVINKKYDDYLRKIKPLEISTPMATLLDEEERTAGLRLRRASTIASTHELVVQQDQDQLELHIKPVTRRSTMFPAGLEKISQMLNSAHIKDFQRRKVKPQENFEKEDSDEEDEDNDTEEEENDVVQFIVDQHRED